MNTDKTSITFNLSALFVSMYQKEKTALKFIIEGAVPKIIMISLYNFLLREEMPPIETLSEEDKILLVHECRETGLQFTNETLTNSAKILHTIKFINANS